MLRCSMSLSPQIQALGYTPSPWTVSDCVAVEKVVTGGLSMRSDVDLIIGLLHATFDREFFSDIYRYQGLDTTAIVPDFYTNRREARAAEGGGRRSRSLLPDLRPEEAIEIARLAGALRLGNSGSNSFAIAGTHTESGHTLIASDTHFDNEHPTVFYFMHLETASAGGDYNAIGATLPGAPFVLFGHNGSASWLPTTGFQDASDTYLETFLPGAVREDGSQMPDSVVYRGEVVEIERTTEVYGGPQKLDRVQRWDGG